MVVQIAVGKDHTVGLKADGTVVIMVNDGRQAPYSSGFTPYEMAEMMKSFGCVNAVNCDGGGSSTFISKRVGEDDFTMRSVPCDGAQRPTAHGVFVASNVAPTGELDVVNVISDYDYFAPYTAYTFEAEAIDTHGYAMDMPADASWALSDNTFGTIDDGKFEYVCESKEMLQPLEVSYEVGCARAAETIDILEKYVYFSAKISELEKLIAEFKKLYEKYSNL